jgi:energy-coupling factor transporter ATP-binding protein EcfA2
MNNPKGTHMTSKLLGIRIENYKRISLVEIDFDPAGGMIALMGPNEAGKSSVIDALASLLEGRKGTKPTQPVHTGADEARIIATFDDLTVTRIYKGGTTKIEVKANGLGKVGAPEELLNRLYSHIGLDPLAFSRLADKEQVGTLLQLIGVDPSTLDAQAATVFARRTDENRDLKALQARLAGMPPAPAGTPTVEVSVADIVAEVTAAEARNAAAVQFERDAARARADVERAKQTVQSLAAQLKNAEQDLSIYTAVLAEFTPDKEPVTVDVAPIREKLGQVEQTNRDVRAASARAEIASQVRAAETAAAASTAELAKIKADKEALLTSKPMPVPGLAISDDGLLLLNGTAFADASTGVKIRTGAAIAMALNPDLRLIVIRDASLLDQGNRKVIDEIAKANEFLVIAEFADENNPVGILLEDGAVKEVRA